MFTNTNTTHLDPRHVGGHVPVPDPVGGAPGEELPRRRQQLLAVVVVVGVDVYVCF